MTDSLHIEDTNLSRAWARGFLALMEYGVAEIIPLVVTVKDIADVQSIEMPSIRQALDQALLRNDKYSCQTVASTIFPRSLWNPALSRARLFDRYSRILPQLRKYRGNAYGLYFERLIAHGPTKVNQIEHIIQTRLNGNRRRSALQAAIFDPTRDHTNQPLRGFPCMQQVTFAPYGKGKLAVTGFYATQYIFDRAYGNYLGLLDLGLFVAHELGLQLTQLNCVTGIALLGDIKKAGIRKDVKQLALKLKTIIGITYNEN